MKNPPNILKVLAAGMLCLSAFSAKAVTPPATWQEHWFEHDQVVERWYYNDSIAIYFDNNTSTANRNTATAWMAPFLTAAWDYTRSTYELGGSEQRLYNIFHTNRYFGGHPDTHFGSGHDYRDVIDIGLSSWVSPSKGIILHEISHIVEFSAYDVQEPSPSRSVWGDSKFAEIYNYDTALGIGDTALAQSMYDDYDDNVDDFPSAGTRWFRNWFYPLWNNYGKTRFLQRYFHLLAYNFPTYTTGAGNQRFSRSMNVGEFVYFMSAAARRDMRDQAAIAFGWTTTRESQYQQARADFPAIDPANPWFMIVNKNSGKSFDLIGGNMSDGAVVNQWSYDYNSRNQRWSLVATENGDHFKIVSWQSDKVLGIAGNSTASGAQLVSNDYVAGNTSQQWDLVYAGDGWYKIQNVRSGLVLDVSNSSTADNAKLQQYTDNGTAAQRFRFHAVGDYFLRTHAGKYLAVQGSGGANGAAVIQSTWQDLSTFKWHFYNTTEGWGRVSSLVNLNRAMRISNSSTTSGADVVIWDFDASFWSEQIRILPLLNGKFKFYFRNSGMAWDIPGGSSADGVPLEQAPDSGYNRQQYKLERIP